MDQQKGIRVWIKEMKNMWNSNPSEFVNVWRLMCICTNEGSANWVASACDFAVKKYEFFVGDRPPVEEGETVSEVEPMLLEI